MAKITGDEPYFPIVKEELLSAYSDTPASMMQVESYGVTIHQKFSESAMNAILSSNPMILHIKPKEVAIMAVAASKALIAELNKEIKS